MHFALLSLEKDYLSTSNNTKPTGCNSRLSRINKAYESALG